MLRRLRVITVALFLGAPALASGQAGTGAITGTIHDSSGGTVPGVVVRIVNEQTRGAVDAVTDERGAYRREALPAGAYRLEIALSGFETAVRQVVLSSGETAAVELTLTPARVSEGVVVTARRVEEAAQEVAIPLTVVNRDLVENAGAFNVNRLKELIPTVQFYSTNPRNSAINIRGLGAPFGLTNDGLEPGVGLYIDGVFYARPASATLDFLDVERIEVLRGPQGTLFGKNTSAGALLMTSKKPTTDAFGTDFEAHALRIVARQVERLEEEIDAMNASLEPLRSFILPGGSTAVSHLHLARAVTRRAERAAVALHELTPVNIHALAYLNRLSDHLFVAARHVASSEGGDVLWQPGATRNS